jgi:hypothetical protein
MAVNPVFPSAGLGAGMYESFYLRAVSPEEPVGAWIRYTVHKRPGRAPRGSLWCTVFDASAGAPLLCKHTTDELTVPADGWIALGTDACLGPTLAEGRIATGEDSGSGTGPGRAERDGSGVVRWSLRIDAEAPELRHLKQCWLYRAPLPRTKLTSPAPIARFEGAIELPGRTLEVRGWKGMVGHNWGSEHAERWIWLHGIGFDEDPSAWLDVAIGRVLVAGRPTPWTASGAISFDGRRVRLGGLGARGLRVAESPARCSLSLPGEGSLKVEAHVDVPPGTAAGWRYADPDGGEHDVVNCSVATLALNARPLGEAARTLHTEHGAAYELGMRERDHGVALAPFPDG